MMKTNAKRKNSAAKKLIPAAGMLALSASMLATSTYAWFTMNKTVEVTGMELKTKVGANLLISSNNDEADYSSETLVEGRKGLLEPVSSINGTTGSFYYTVNANARGQKETNATITNYNEDTLQVNSVAGKYYYDDGFNSDYGNGSSFTSNTVKMTDAQNGAAYGYIDYVFYLKATADTNSQVLNMTECNLLMNNGTADSAIGTGTAAGVDIDRAWRVGVFSQKLTTGGGEGNTGDIGAIDPASSTANQKAILGLASSSYFTTTNGGQAQTSSGLADVVNFKNGAANTAGVTLDTLSNRGDTAYYKVLVRVWLEGEDDTCNSATYAALQDNKWKLNCKFELGQGTAITALNSNTNNVATTTVTQVAVTDPIEVATTAANNG